MNNPYQKDDGGGMGDGGFGQWQNPQSPQVFNQMLGRGGGTPYQPQGLKQGRPGRNLFGPPQNGGINPGGMYGGGGMTGSGPYNPYSKPGSISGAQPPGGPYGKPGNTGPMPPTPGPKRPPEDPGVYWGPSQTDPYGGGTIFGSPMGSKTWGGAMSPPDDLPGPRFPTPGNTGPLPPAPGPQRPIDPRNAPITPPPPPNGDGWGPSGPEGGPPPIEDPHGQFPISNPQHDSLRASWAGWQPGPRRPMGGDQGYGAEPFRWRT